ncbi:MAG: hypothetical protein N2037_01930 [Acidimicrobiales bacterium]|nr:hypothetical protein [Acidimicrobiales bacterium]
MQLRAPARPAQLLGLAIDDLAVLSGSGTRAALAAEVGLAQVVKTARAERPELATPGPAAAKAEAPKHRANAAHGRKRRRSWLAR